MIAAQPGITARYNIKESDENRKIVSRQLARPVIAFTDDGEPLVIGDASKCENRKLIRADVYDNYIGMTYSPVVLGPLGVNPALPGASSDEVESQPSQWQETFEDDSNHQVIVSMTEWEVAAVEFAALRALELAGKRQISKQRRAWRGELQDVPAWEFHTRLPIDNEEKALDGAFELLRTCLPGREDVYAVIERYVRERLTTRKLHDVRRLLTMLAESGCLARLR
ncbi:hypothetical protein [Saccharopolyspora sp. NPDC002376]